MFLKLKIKNSQKGVALIITFLVMTIMLAIVLGISVILLSEIKIVSNLGNSVSALYASESGIEKTLYLDRKQAPPGTNRGFCSICSLCSPGPGSNNCSSCSSTPLVAGGCGIPDPMNCSNCRVQYTTDFDNRQYVVDAKVVPNLPNPPIFTTNSRGIYKDTTRVVEATVTQ